jgi:hypothetical protein
MVPGTNYEVRRRHCSNFNDLEIGAWHQLRINRKLVPGTDCDRTIAVTGGKPIL